MVGDNRIRTHGGARDRRLRDVRLTRNNTLFLISASALLSLGFTLVEEHAHSAHIDISLDAEHKGILKPHGERGKNLSEQEIIAMIDSTMMLELVDPAFLDRTVDLVDRKKFQKELQSPGEGHYNSFRTDLLWPKEPLDAQDITLPTKDYGWEFTWPVEDVDRQGQGALTSRYGRRWGRRHNGIDLRLKSGDSLYAMFSGKVRYAGWAGGYGRVVIIRHHNGLESLYGHMSKIDVKPGELVHSGTPIGKGGNTGRSTGPHLHLELRYRGYPMDPAQLIDTRAHRIKGKVVRLRAGRWNRLLAELLDGKAEPTASTGM